MPEKILIKIILAISSLCAKLPFNQIFLPTPKLYMLVIYYCLMAYVIYKFVQNKTHYLRVILRKKYFIDFVKHSRFVKKFVAGTCIALCIFSLYNVFPKGLRINMLDVSQGDCTLIRTNENKVILIDSGTGNSEDEYDYGKNVVMPYLLDHGIMKIDYMIISHFDSDHCGGMFYILENMKVGQIIIGKQAEEYENCVEFIKLAKAKNVAVQVLEAGDQYKFGSAYMEVYFPDTANTISENKINNNSLVFKFCYGDFSMLFTGDIEEETEKMLVSLYGNALQATALKVAHHGSKSSSTQEFLECVNPKIALIGVGENNTYGHPNEEVLERLQNLGYTVYRTDVNGEIAIKLKKGRICIKTLYT